MPSEAWLPRVDIYIMYFLRIVISNICLQNMWSICSENAQFVLSPQVSIHETQCIFLSARTETLPNTLFLCYDEFYVV